MGSRHGVDRLGLHVGDLLAQPGHLGLELEHPAHPFEVEPRRRQLLDAAQALEVAPEKRRLPPLVRDGSSRPLRS